MGEFIKLGSLVDIRTGKLNANAANENGCYPFFTCSVEPLTINTYAYDCESVLIAGNGDLNVKYYNGKFNAYQRTYIIESKDKDILSVRFLYYFLCEYIDTLRNNSIGGVIKYIKLSDLTDINFPLIPIQDQKRIVKILDKAQEIRTKKKLANEKLDEFLKSTFIDMFGDPVTNPKGYKKELIKNICSTATGSTPSRDNPQYYQNAIISWVKTGEVLNSYIKKTEERISQKAIDETNCKIFPVNTILVAMYGQGLTRGRVGMLKIEAATNQACCAILPGEKINQEFLFNLLKLEYETLRNLGRGGNQPNLNKGMINDFVIYLPPLEQQNQFAQIVQKVEAQKEKNQKVIEQMDNLFNSLMQQAFNSGL